MGMESYFVKIQFFNMTKKNIINILGEENFTIKNTINKKFIINNIVFMGYENKTLIILEGCFSCYKKSLSIINNIINIINNKESISIIHPMINFYNFNNFETILKNIYEEKYNTFKTTFGNIEIEILPGETFYNYIEKK